MCTGNKIRWSGMSMAMTVLAATGPVQAALIAHDGFGYTAGSYTTGAGQTSLNGGTGWANNWNSVNTITVNSPTLQYASGGDLSVSGNRVEGFNGTGVYRTTSSQFSGASQTFWVSLLLDTKANSSNFYLIEASTPDYLGFSLGGAGVEEFDLPTLATILPASNLVVLKLVFSSDNLSVAVTGWVNPSVATPNEAGLGTPGVTGSDSSSTGGWNLNLVAFAADSDTQWDEIRIGTTLNDVLVPVLVPEPGSLFALGAGGLLLACRRRRS